MGKIQAIFGKRVTKTLLVFLGLYLICFGIRFTLSKPLSAKLSSDEPDYFSLSTSLMEANGFTDNGKTTAWRTPGYPFFLAILRQFVGNDIVGLRVASILITSLIAPLIYILALVLYENNLLLGQRVGIIAGLFWTGMLNSITLSGSLLGEEIATLLFLLFLICSCLALRKESFWLLLVASVLVAFGVFTRGYLLLTVFTLPTLFLLKKKWALALCSLLVSGVLLGSWCYRNYVYLGTFSISTEANEVIWMGNSPLSKGSWSGWSSRDCEAESPLRDYLVTHYSGFCGISESEKSRIFSTEIRNNFPEFVTKGLMLSPKKTLIFFSPKSYYGIDVVYLISFCFSIPGFFYFYWKSKRDAHILVLTLLPIIFCLFISLISFADIRFRHPINIQVSILGACGIIFLTDLFRTHFMRGKNQNVVSI